MPNYTEELQNVYRKMFETVEARMPVMNMQLEYSIADLKEQLDRIEKKLDALTQNQGVEYSRTGVLWIPL